MGVVRLANGVGMTSVVQMIVATVVSRTALPPPEIAIEAQDSAGKMIAPCRKHTPELDSWDCSVLWVHVLGWQVKSYKVAWLILARFGCFALSTVVVTRVLAQSRKLIPFTAEKTTTYYVHPTGKFVKREQSFVAVRSDGSRVDSRMTVFANKEAEQKEIRNVPLKQHTSVDGLTESISTYPMNDQELREGITGFQNCPAGPTSPRTKAFGFDAVKITQQFGTWRNERWVIPELNCLVITSSVFVDNDPKPSTIAQTITLRVGEPNQQLFAIPSGFTERSPSEVDAEMLRRYPEAVPENAKALSNSDRFYYKSRGPAQ
jgi:hypothetical protein